MSSATIRFHRPAGAYRDAVRRYRVLVDGVEVGRIKPGEEFVHTVEPGAHLIRAKIDWSGSADTKVNVTDGQELDVIIRPGSASLFDAFFSTDKWIDVQAN
jgi:hypothetical protein